MINKLLDAFLSSLGESLTDQSYRTPPVRIRRWYLEIEERDTVKVEDLTEFKKWLESEGLSGSTVNTYMTVMRKIFRLGAALELLDSNLHQRAEDHLATMSGGRVVYNRRRISEDDIQKVLAYYKNVQEPEADEKTRNRIARLNYMRTRAMVYAIEDTGLRITELLNLNRAELDDFLIHWNGEGDLILPIMGKGSKIRDAIFGKKSLVKISEYLAQRGPDRFKPLFISHGNRSQGGRPKRQTVNGILSKVSSSLGLTESFLSPHAYRHHFGDKLAKAGVVLEDRQDLMGHSDPRTTKQVYTHSSRTSHLAKAKREAFEDDDKEQPSSG